MTRTIINQIFKDSLKLRKKCTSPMRIEKKEPRRFAG
jgi:hypothetical protein